MEKTIKPKTGFSLLEILIAISILGLAAAPLMNSTRNNATIAARRKDAAIEKYAAIGKMEEIMSMSFSAIALSGPQGAVQPILSDTVTIGGTVYARTVIINNYDGDGDSIADTDIKAIAVTVGRIRLDSLKARLEVKQLN